MSCVGHAPGRVSGDVHAICVPVVLRERVPDHLSDGVRVSSAITFLGLGRARPPNIALSAWSGRIAGDDHDATILIGGGHESAALRLGQRRLARCPRNSE